MKEVVEDEHETAGTAKLDTEKPVSTVVENTHSSAEKQSGIMLRKKEYTSGDVRNDYVNYAYQIGGMDLVVLIECESATWNMFRKADGTEKSYGFCQINQKYHPEIVNNEMFWNDPYRQLDKCAELMKQGTAFYGRDRKIKGVKCSQYVLDRFEEYNGNFIITE